jgi:hypothetical protein
VVKLIKHLNVSWLAKIKLQPIALAKFDPDQSPLQLVAPQ